MAIVVFSFVVLRLENQLESDKQVMKIKCLKNKSHGGASVCGQSTLPKCETIFGLLRANLEFVMFEIGEFDIKR